MGSFDVRVRLAPAGSGLIGRPEHCSADPDRLAAIGSAVGMQVRLTRPGGELAVYTVSEAAPGDGAVVRVGAAGRRRLGGGGEFDAVLDTRVPRPDLTPAEAEAAGELVELLSDDGAQAGLVVLAPHGGAIERHTDRQADLVAVGLDVSSWRCKGWKPGGGAFARWHITSADLSELSFPLLGRVAGRGFARAVAFHGFDDAGVEGDVLVGGSAPGPLKEAVAAAVRDVLRDGLAVRVPAPGERLGGDDPRNVVNRLAPGGGVQIEQSLRVRAGHWRAVAEAVGGVLELLSRPG
jgi:phage replication-related protein YjqB (UPF0714/DUF867 family)